MIAFLKNPMLSVTSKSYKKALRISTYHDNALAVEKADPFILSLYNRYHESHVNLKTAIDTWNLHVARKEGTTLTLKRLIRLLSSTKISDWDVAVQSQFNIKTAEYKTILPHHRIPFQNGTQLERLHAVEVLNNAVGNYASLADLKTDIDDFNNQLKTAYALQKQQIFITKSKSEAIEPLRVAMCIAQYRNLGALINQYAANPKNIQKYFDSSI